MIDLLKDIEKEILSKFNSEDYDLSKHQLKFEKDKGDISSNIALIIAAQKSVEFKIKKEKRDVV